MDRTHKFVKSSRGANLLVNSDYVHRKRTRKGSTIYWTCVSDGCKGKITTFNDSIVSVTEHNHEPDVRKVLTYKQRSLVKEMVRENRFRSCKETYNVVTNEIIQSDAHRRSEIASSLLTFEQLKKSIFNSRSLRFPTVPHSRSEVQVPDCLSIDNSGEKFFQLSDGDNDKILIFASENFIRILCSSDHIYSDGTFKSVPRIFHSLYTFHVIKNGIMIPVIYSLIPDASIGTYLRLIRLIQDICSKYDLIWNPLIITTDFEFAVHQAIKIIFPQITIKSCLFHFSQALWRNVGKQNLVNRYKDNQGDNDVKITIKRISGLPFLQHYDIPIVYGQIKSSSPSDNDMRNFLEYFESTYLNSNSRFPISTWNHFNNSDPRTNNHIEGWHAALNRSVGRSHANLWLFIEKLIEQQNNFDSQLLMAAHGTRSNNQPLKYRQINQKINVLTFDYSNHLLSPFDFVDRVKYFTRLNHN